MRVCLACTTTVTDGALRMNARWMYATYTFNAATSYLLAFSGGGASYNGQTLPSGCHAGQAAAGDVIRLRGASRVRLEAPSQEGCPTS